MVFHDDLPVLVALVHQQNISSEAKFLKVSLLHTSLFLSGCWPMLSLPNPSTSLELHHRLVLQTLTAVAEDLYREVVVVTVDVGRYPAWAGQFVPRQRTLPSKGERLTPLPLGASMKRHLQCHKSSVRPRLLPALTQHSYCYSHREKQAALCFFQCRAIMNMAG